MALINSKLEGSFYTGGDITWRGSSVRWPISAGDNTLVYCRLVIAASAFHSISKWRLPVPWVLSPFRLEYLHMTHEGRGWGDPKVPWTPLLVEWASLGRSCGSSASISTMLLDPVVWLTMTSTMLTLFVTKMENRFLNFAHPICMKGLDSLNWETMIPSASWAIGPPPMRLPHNLHCELVSVVVM